MPYNSESIFVSEKLQVSFSTVSPFLKNILLPRTEKCFLPKGCCFCQLILQRTPIVCCDQWNSCCLYCLIVSHGKTIKWNLKVNGTLWTLFSWCCNIWDRASSTELQERELRDENGLGLVSVTDNRYVQQTFQINEGVKANQILQEHELFLPSKGCLTFFCQGHRFLSSIQCGSPCSFMWTSNDYWQLAFLLMKAN